MKIEGTASLNKYLYGTFHGKMANSKLDNGARGKDPLFFCDIKVENKFSFFIGNHQGLVYPH